MVPDEEEEEQDRGTDCRVSTTPFVERNRFVETEGSFQSDPVSVRRICPSEDDRIYCRDHLPFSSPGSSHETRCPLEANIVLPTHRRTDHISETMHDVRIRTRDASTGN